MMLPAYSSTYSGGPRRSTRTQGDDAPILITPYGSGTGTPEEEEELALLEHWEKMQQHGSPPAWDELAQAQVGAELPPLPEEAHAEDGEWEPGSELASASDWRQPRSSLPVVNDPPQQGWGPGAGAMHADARELEQMAGALGPVPPHDNQEGPWSPRSVMEKGQARHAWPPGDDRGRHVWQSPHMMASSATPALPPAAPRQLFGREQRSAASENGSAGLPVSKPKNERKKREERGARSSRGWSGSPILGQQAPAKAEANKLKPYHELPKGANAVVLYNGKAPTGWYQGGQTSNGTTFKEQGMRVLGDFGGNAQRNPRMIDISEPGWMRKLDDLMKKNGKFDHVFVFDHGNVGRVAFGAHPGAYPEFTGLDKDSGAARVIGSVLAPHGTLHLGSCFTGNGEIGFQYLKGLHETMDQGKNISIEAITGPMHNRTNQFGGELITFPPRQPQPQPLP